MARANSLLQFFGIAYMSGARTGSVSMFEPHPLTEGLSSLLFRGGFALGLTSAAVDAQRIASLPSRLGPSEPPEAIGYAQERGLGRVFVWGTSGSRTTRPGTARRWRASSGSTPSAG